MTLPLDGIICRLEAGLILLGTSWGGLCLNRMRRTVHAVVRDECTVVSGVGWVKIARGLCSLVRTSHLVDEAQLHAVAFCCGLVPMENHP